MRNQMKTLYVIKIGGNVIDDESNIASFLNIFKEIEIPKLLVHGGGKLATNLAEQLQIPQQIIEGRRVTDEETLKVVTMVYAGYINKQLVALLQSADCPAIGLSGVDANLVKAHRRQKGDTDFGFVGDIDEVNISFLQTCIQSNLIPVIAPITHDKKGQLLNTNADTIAKYIAVAMTEYYQVKLIYCFEKEGVLQNFEMESSCIDLLDFNEFQRMKQDRSLHSGMIPKLDMAFKALENGVDSVSIGKWEDLTDLVKGKKGTRLKMNHKLVNV
jgi:acetylglutamate kinase